MGLDATDAANATHAQVQQAGLSSNIGVTAMIGINDTNTEIFKLADVNTLLNFATSNTYITRLSFWSLARDNGGGPHPRLAPPAGRRLYDEQIPVLANFEAVQKKQLRLF